MCSIFWDDLFMQGRSRLDRDLWDAGEITGHLVPPGSVFAFLAEHRAELFPGSFTADLFPSRTGRPSLPPDLVGSVLVLRELYDLSDAQTADALKFDIRWKVACGRSLMQMSFDPSALVYWRRRIAKSKRPDRVFDAVAEVIAQVGILRGRRKRCVDSTVFDDAVATQDTVTQLMAAIRKVARVVPGAGEVIAAVCKLDYSRPGKPAIDWDDPQAKEALVSDLVNDALQLLDVLAGPDAPERDAAAADALGLLALVAGQDVEPAEDSDGTDGRWRIARKVAPDRVVSTVDREARHTRKCKSKRRDGFRGHVAAEPETGLITDCEMTMAAGPGSTDAENGVKMARRDRFHPGGANPASDGGTDAAGASPSAAAALQPGAAATAEPEPEPGAGVPAGKNDQGGEDGLEVYGDSAYGSGEARAACRDAGHDTVIKPKPLQPAVPGGFTLDDFTVDEEQGTVTCPAGLTRAMSQARTVTFGAACASCPLRQRCTTARDGRSMSIHPHEGLLRAARARARTGEFKRAYPTRSMIERIIAWTATQNGHRVRLRYIGTSRNDAWLHNRCAALNLRTLIKRGLTSRDGAWTLS
jgi:IS5 family transposase